MLNECDSNNVSQLDSIQLFFDKLVGNRSVLVS